VQLSDGTFAVKIFKPDRASTSPTPEGLPSDMASLTYLQTSGTVDAEELKEGFKREIETLRRFSGEDHPHLISLLAAFRHGDDYCVIFRWARCDLKTLWRDSAKWNWDPDPLSKPTLQWMLEQCRGIASGLHRIHRYTRSETMADGHLAAPHNNIIYGRHGDIKPENILVFCKQNQPEDRGTLVITDFGLTRFHTEGTKSYFSSKDVLNTFSYRPPECDMEECRITQSFDIWSFGCVLLEFIAWYLGGWALVLKFVRVRKTIDPVLNGWNVDQFFEAVRPEGETEGPVFFRVKLEVHQFVINELHAHPKCSEPIHKLLDYIMTHMLVVVSRGVQQRDDSSQVHTELDKLCKMVAPPEYKLVPSPRKTALAEIPIPEAVEMPLNQIAKQNTAARFNQLREHTGRTRRLPPHSPRRTQTHPPHGN
jgi:serine/threonine protein kinase